MVVLASTKTLVILLRVGPLVSELQGKTVYSQTRKALAWRTQANGDFNKYSDGDKTEITQEWVQTRDFVNTVMNRRVPLKKRNVLTDNNYTFFSYGL